MDKAEVVLANSKRGYRVRQVSKYLTPEESKLLMHEIDKTDELREETVVMFGKNLVVPRRTAAYATDQNLSYRYAGKTMSAKRAPPSILQLLEKLKKDTKEEYNFVLVQEYKDGNVGIGWHADDERDIFPNSTIASISLGATRDFQLRENEHGSEICTVPLESGSLLTMEGTCQKFTKHCVPKRARQRGRRINLTFRKITNK